MEGLPWGAGFPWAGPACGFCRGRGWPEGPRLPWVALSTPLPPGGASGRGRAGCPPSSCRVVVVVSRRRRLVVVSASSPPFVSSSPPGQPPACCPLPPPRGGGQVPLSFHGPAAAGLGVGDFIPPSPSLCCCWGLGQVVPLPRLLVLLGLAVLALGGAGGLVLGRFSIFGPWPQLLLLLPLPACCSGTRGVRVRSSTSSSGGSRRIAEAAEELPRPIGLGAQA